VILSLFYCASILFVRTEEMVQQACGPVVARKLKMVEVVKLIGRKVWQMIAAVLNHGGNHSDSVTDPVGEEV